MRLTHLIYASRPFGFDAGVLDDILVSARRNNARDGITGSLVCRADMFLQLLEGPGEAVTAAIARILRDDRHIEAVILHCADAPERLFADWTMRDDPPQSWMWTQDQVRAGALREATAAQALDVFRRLAAMPRAR